MLMSQLQFQKQKCEIRFLSQYKKSSVMFKQTGLDACFLLGNNMSKAIPFFNRSLKSSSGMEVHTLVL